MVSLLTRTQIEERAPSVYATEHDGERSDRYTFVSTDRVISEFNDIGWGVREAMQPRCRKSDPLHSKHLLRFTPRADDLSFSDPRNPGNLVNPEILFFNSSNGSQRVKLMSGCFAMVCSNGMIVVVPGFEDLMETTSRKHQGFDANIIYAATQEMANNFEGFFNTVSEMTQHDLDGTSRMRFAREAAEIRFPDVDVDAGRLLQTRRGADAGHDIWTTFNVIQENCIRGGFKLDKRTARELTNIDALDRVNSGLWDVAESMLVTALVESVA